MIFIDIDGPIVDFIGTTKKFGIELKANEFGKWKWGVDHFPTPEEFYANAELQPWFDDLRIETIAAMDGNRPMFITKNYGGLKQKLIYARTCRTLAVYDDVKDRSTRCKYPTDLLIDDNAAECEAWRAKGGIAWHFDLASDTPFDDFLKFWRPRGAGVVL